MEWSTWFRRKLLNNNNDIDSVKFTTQKQPNTTTKVEEGEELGITPQLIDYVDSFTVDTFKQFSVQEEQHVLSTKTASSNVRLDLSEWQERHATVVLSKVKGLPRLRFALCPRYMKERDFWRVYFSLVKHHVAEYELRSVLVAKLKQMASPDSENASETAAVEVEMAETKQPGG